MVTATNDIGAIRAAYALEEMQHYELTEVVGNSDVAAEKRSVVWLAEIHTVVTLEPSLHLQGKTEAQRSSCEMMG